jgi:energy-coupling factor transporter ATP-binding protein EcfA2
VNAAVLGIPKKLVAQELDEIVDFAELGEFIDAPVQSYSSGMQVRLGFSIATALKPDILLLDEVLAVGDATFRSKCIKRIGATLNKAAVVFVSHDAWSIRRICDSVILLDRGTTAYQGDTETGMELYAESTEDGGARQPFLNVAPFVTSVVHRAELHRRALRDGGEAIDVDVTISFDSDRTLTPGFCHGNLITLDEMVLGQFDFGPWFPRIERGRNLISFRVVGVQLARGRYTMTVQVYDDTKKEIVLNLRHFILITFSGNMRYGPRYAIATEPIPLAPPSSA